MSRSNMCAFRCIHTRNPYSPSWLNEVKVDLNGYCALIGQSHNRCGRSGCKIERALIPSHPIFIGATRYDWPMYRAIARLRTSESYRVAAPLQDIVSMSTAFMSLTQTYLYRR